VKLNELVVTSHAISRSKGWYDGEDAVRNIPEMLVLIHSEISEALEDYRNGKMEEWFDENGKPCGFPSEIADIVIRCGDLCGYLNVDLQGVVERKTAFNRTRPYRHGGKRA
jgi:NTP pyrophosphatase (non-canonical NTP hydrolase)